MITRRPSRGFTLIELMAVIALITLVTGMVTVSIVAGTDTAALREASGRWRDMDRRARIMAHDAGPVVIQLDAGGARVELVSGGDGAVLAETTFPEGVLAALSPATLGRAVSCDRLGRSDDYEVSFTCGERELAWSVHGLSGFVAEVEP